MTCPHCGHDNPEHSKFCNQCGKALPPSLPPLPPAAPKSAKRKSTSWGGILAGGIGIIFLAFITASMMQNFQGAVERGKIKRTMADVKTLATTWETYFIDFNTYCPRDGAVGSFEWGNLSADDLQRILCPTYIYHLPTLDGWGRPFQFAVSCAGPENQSYGIRSMGPDGLWAPDKQPWNADQFQDYDIVLKDGQFFMSPEGYCPP